MEIWFPDLCSILMLIILLLLIKIRLMQKSAWEIKNALEEKLASDTNTLIDISSHDWYMRRLAASLNRELRKLRNERHHFQQGDMELKEAITNISHDLRTPLTAICGYLELLEREEKSNTVNQYLEIITNRTEVLNQLTDELFRYSIVTSIKESTMERVNVKRALEESLLSYYGTLEQKGIRPEIFLPDAPVERWLDSSAISRIFSNIINNATKYSDGDFTIQMDSQCNITFSNTASHLTPVAVGRLFDRFYTVETGRNSTGLGLSIAKILTERMGGTIQARYQDEKLFITLSFPER